MCIRDRRDALTLAAAEGGGAARGIPREADKLEEAVDLSSRLRSADSLARQGIADVSGHIEVTEQLPVLEHHREATPMGGHPRQIRTVEAHRARRERFEPGDGPQQAGLATP